MEGYVQEKSCKLSKNPVKSRVKKKIIKLALWILSPLRLPIPPHQRTPEYLPPAARGQTLLQEESSTTASEWMGVDSNHRSNLQQIYSLSPLATREPIRENQIKF